MTAVNPAIFPAERRRRAEFEAPPTHRAWSVPIDAVLLRDKMTGRAHEVSSSELPSDGSHMIVVRSAENTRPMPAKIVSKTYRVVQHKEVCTAIEDALHMAVDPNQMLGAHSRTTLDNNGISMVRQYVLPALNLEMRTVKHGYGEGDVGFRVIMLNSYGGSSIQMFTGAIDFWCNNGMVIGDMVDVMRWRHTSGFEVSRIADALKEAIKRFHSMRSDIIRMMASHVADDFDVQQFLLDCGMSKRRAANIAMQYYQHERDIRGNSLWGVYSAMTADVEAQGLTERQQQQAGLTNLRRELRVEQAIRSTRWQDMLMEHAA